MALKWSKNATNFKKQTMVLIGNIYDSVGQPSKLFSAALLILLKIKNLEENQQNH
jgi:hypothetical protein